MSHRCTFADVLIELPAGWVDVCDEMPEGYPPTLARVDGVGALLFTVARYQSGANPDVHADDLDALLREFARTRSLGVPSDVEHGEAANRYIGGTFVQGTDLTRVWYASNGSDLALVTYAAEVGNPACSAELADARSSVRSIDFD